MEPTATFGALKSIFSFKPFHRFRGEKNFKIVGLERFDGFQYFKWCLYEISKKESLWF
jgi:hypothetical protein